MISNYRVYYIIVFKFYYLFLWKKKSLHKKKKKNELNNTITNIVWANLSQALFLIINKNQIINIMKCEIVIY